VRYLHVQTLGNRERCNSVRARSIIELSCLEPNYTISVSYLSSKNISLIFPHNTCYLGPLIPMLPCLAWCLHGSQALISLLSHLIHISISLAISPLLYLLFFFHNGKAEFHYSKATKLQEFKNHKRNSKRRTRERTAHLV
jgi:hypothetical protein